MTSHEESCIDIYISASNNQFGALHLEQKQDMLVRHNRLNQLIGFLSILIIPSHGAVWGHLGYFLQGSPGETLYWCYLYEAGH